MAGHQGGKHPLIWYVFLLFLSLIPVLILESLLRLSSFGMNFPLLVKTRGADGVVVDSVNTAYPQRFLHGAQTDFKLRDGAFLHSKPANGFRIALIGTGLIYAPDRTDPAFVLRDSLQAHHPGISIEVVNLSLPNSSSFILREIVRDLGKEQVDLLVLAPGDGEFYGLMGSASKMGLSSSFFFNELNFRLEKVRIFQLLRSLFPFEELDTLSLGSDAFSLAKDREIPYLSESYLKTRRFLLQNLAGIADDAAGRNSRVLMLVLPEPLDSQAPREPLFRDSDLDPDSLANEFRAALQNRDSLEIRRIMNYLRIWEPASAMTAYFRGLIYQRDGMADSAWNALNLALNLDAFRDRASADFSRALRQAAEEKGWTLADLRREFYDRGICYSSAGRPDSMGYSLLEAALFARCDSLLSLCDGDENRNGAKILKNRNIDD